MPAAARRDIRVRREIRASRNSRTTSLIFHTLSASTAPGNGRNGGFVRWTDAIAMGINRGSNSSVDRRGRGGDADDCAAPTGSIPQRQVDAVRPRRTELRHFITEERNDVHPIKLVGQVLAPHGHGPRTVFGTDRDACVDQAVRRFLCDVVGGPEHVALPRVVAR